MYHLLVISTFFLIIRTDCESSNISQVLGAFRDAAYYKLEVTHDTKNPIMDYCNTVILDLDHLIYTRLSILYSNLTSSQACDVTWAVGTLYSDTKSTQVYKIRKMSIELLLSCISIPGPSKRISSKDVCKAIVGLARMGCKASDAQNRVSLYEIVDYLDQYMDEASAQGLSNLIWAMGIIEYKYCDIPSEMKHKLLTSVQEKGPDFTDQGLSSLLFGLAKMNVNWMSLQPAIKSTIFSILSRVSLKMSSHATGVTLYSLGNVR